MVDRELFGILRLGLRVYKALEEVVGDLLNTWIDALLSDSMSDWSFVARGAG